MGFSRCIDNSLYSRKALVNAREAYVDYCSVLATPKTDGLVDVTVTVKPEYARESRQVTLEFWNYLLDLVCKQKIEAV